MASSMGPTASIVIFFSLLAIGFSMKCFQCNSAIDPECEDVIANDTSSPFYKTCEEFGDEKYFICRKLITAVENVEYSERIVRTCGFKNDDNLTEESCKISDTDFVKRMSCACFTDGCNSSPGSADFHWTSMIVSWLMLFVFQLYH